MRQDLPTPVSPMMISLNKWSWVVSALSPITSIGIAINASIYSCSILDYIIIIFSNIILADEINRTPPKTQAALLEAMQERSVTVAGHHYKLDAPYFVLATQNPIEQEGTYPLPEAQLDRFMFSINLTYPSFQEEVQVVKQTTANPQSKVDVVFSATEILEFQALIRKIPVADNVIEYAVKMVGKTRPDSLEATQLIKQYIDWGAGPRASQNLILAAKTYAVINGKLSPDNEDVQAVAISILRHRIIKNYKAEADGVSVESIIEISPTISGFIIIQTWVPLLMYLLKKIFSSFKNTS